MDAYQDLVKTILNISKGSLKENFLTSIIVGEVKTINPLTISIGEDITLPQSFLYLSSTCKRKEIDNTHYHTFTDKNDGEGSSGSVSNSKTSNEIPNSYTYKGKTTAKPTKIILWEDLQVGEKVLLLRVNKGQKYWVLDRVGG